MNRVPLLAMIALALLLGGCKKKKEGLRHDEALQEVAAADRRLAEQENQMLSRRGNLQRERSQLRDKREELLTKKAGLDENDAQGREAVEKEESKLNHLDQTLATEEMTLNKKLMALLDEKTGLIDKLGEKAGRDAITARREYGAALREKDVARRESELARRERVLAEREKAFAERQARGCGKTTTVVMAPPTGGGARGGGGAYGRKDVEPVFKEALRAMQSKGILIADLPAGIDRMVTEVRHSVSSGDYTRGKYAADQLLATVRSMKIDRSFIGAKIGRLSASIRSNPPKDKSKVNGLFQKATSAYGDGRFLEANQLLNRIYAQLR
jgi:hypothetical protein